VQRFAIAVALGLLASGCSKGDNAPPVATVSFSASKARVPLAAPIDLTYRFNVAPNAAISGDYRVFVHMLDDNGNPIAWNDDHDPKPPTSQWKPGQTVEYTHTVFVPVSPYVGDATVEVGLYKGNDRLPLTGSDGSDKTATARAYKVGTIHLLPPSENIFLIRKSGWHPAEFGADNPGLEWQWTQKTAVIAFKNPKRDITFYLEFDARTDVFSDHPQQITVYSGSQVVESFTADNGGAVLKRIAVSAAQLGDAEQAELRVEVDRTFVPSKLPAGGKDVRELGLRVYHAYVEAR
jgi:hypothetical protein